MSAEPDPYDFTDDEIGPLLPQVAGGGLGGDVFEVRRVPPRESTRRVLALALVFLFSIVILLSLCAVVFEWVSAGTVKSVLEVQLPPIVALTGSALGFYFGVERRES